MANSENAKSIEKSALPGILILTHGNLGDELIRSASMIFGNLDGVRALCLQEGDDPDLYKIRLEETLDEMPEDSLVMVDLFGGTPSNSLMRVALERDVLAVSGANMPMLIEAANLRLFLSGKELLNEVVKSTHAGVVNITELMNR
jgi:mannose/fructose-specific phosphotransferase system component IIA